MARLSGHSPQTRDAVRVLGVEIARLERERRWTTVGLAERAGVSPPTVEAGTPTVAIGPVVERATLLGIDLLGADRSETARLVHRGRERLALPPARVRQPTTPVDDAF